jgi:hypothetical protein
VWKLPSLLKLLSNGGPLFSCSWTLDHLSSKLGFDGIADFINDEGYGHYSTLLTELRTEDGKAFYNYTKLPRGLYDEVLRRVEGRIEKDTSYRKSRTLSNARKANSKK